MTTSFPPINYPNKPVPPFTAPAPRNPFPGFYPDMWRNITGKPYITVSSKGLANGLSEYFNDGADFGPDSLQADGSLTQTSGILEALEYRTTINQVTGRTVPNANIIFKSGVYNIQSPVVIYDDWFVFMKGENSIIDDVTADRTWYNDGTAGVVIQSNSSKGNFVLLRNPVQYGQNTIPAGGFIFTYDISFNQLVEITDPIDSKAVWSGAGAFTLNQPIGPQINNTSNTEIPCPDQLVFNNVSIVDQSGYNGVFALITSSEEVSFRFYGYIRFGVQNAQYQQSVFTLACNQFQSYADIEITMNAPSTAPVIDASNYAAMIHFRPGDNWFISDIDFLGVTAGHFYIESGSPHVTVPILNFTNELSAPVVNGTTLSPSVGGYYGIFAPSVPLQIYRSNFDINSWMIFTGYFNSTSSYGPSIQNINGIILDPVSFNAILAYGYNNSYIEAGIPVPSLSVNPPVSGTVYQNTNPYDIEIDLPTYATTSGTAGYVTLAKGMTDTLTAIGNQFVSGSTSSTSTDIIRLRVPAGWYYSFTGSGVTFATATPFAE